MVGVSIYAFNSRILRITHAECNPIDRNLRISFRIRRAHKVRRVGESERCSTAHPIYYRHHPLPNTRTDMWMRHTRRPGNSHLRPPHRPLHPTPTPTTTSGYRPSPTHAVPVETPSPPARTIANPAFANSHGTHD